MDLKGKKVYISGPITGMPLHNAPAFAEAHAMLRELGADEIFNPTHIWFESKAFGTYERYMRKCLEELTRGSAGFPHYNTIVMLDGFAKSRGACLELDVARTIGMRDILLHDLRNIWNNQREG